MGEGEERNNLENLIEKLDLKDIVCLLGKKENPYIYEECRLICFKLKV